jgi:hypothetical protein
MAALGFIAGGQAWQNKGLHELQRLACQESNVAEF